MRWGVAVKSAPCSTEYSPPRGPQGNGGYHGNTANVYMAAGLGLTWEAIVMKLGVVRTKQMGRALALASAIAPMEGAV